jgi:hypothetical protein
LVTCATHTHTQKKKKGKRKKQTKAPFITAFAVILSRQERILDRFRGFFAHGRDFARDAQIHGQVLLRGDRVRIRIVVVVVVVEHQRVEAVLHEQREGLLKRPVFGNQRGGVRDGILGERLGRALALGDFQQLVPLLVGRVLRIVEKKRGNKNKGEGIEK